MIMRGAIADQMIADLQSRMNVELGASAILEARDGLVPTDIGDPDVGNILLSFAMANPVFLAPVGSTATANTPSDATCGTAGTITYWVMKTSTGGNRLLQWTEGDDFITDDPTFLLGDTCHIDDLTLNYDIQPGTA